MGISTQPRCARVRWAVFVQFIFVDMAHCTICLQCCPSLRWRFESLLAVMWKELNQPFSLNRSLRSCHLMSYGMFDTNRRTFAFRSRPRSDAWRSCLFHSRGETDLALYTGDRDLWQHSKIIIINIAIIIKVHNAWRKAMLLWYENDQYWVTANVMRQMVAWHQQSVVNQPMKESCSGNENHNRC